MGRPNVIGKTTPPAEAERPWQGDIQRIERTLQETLLAISQVSGVNLPDGAAHLHDGEGAPSRLDNATLKDRIRNDLEAFSVTTVSEMSKQAEERARAALANIQTEVSGRIEQAVAEYREKLQAQTQPQQFDIDISKQSRDRVEELVNAQTDEFARWVWMTCKGTGTSIPIQIQGLLEPYVEEATARVRERVQQQVQELMAEQDKLVQEKLQGTASSFENRIMTLEEAAQQICERNADSVTRLSEERLNAAAEEAVRNFEGKIQEQIGGALGGVRTQMDEASAEFQNRLQQEQEQKVQDIFRRIDEQTSELEGTRTSEIKARIEESAAQVMDAAVQRLQQQARDLGSQSQDDLRAFFQQKTDEALRRIEAAGQSVQESVQQNAERLRERLEGMDQDLAGIRQKCLADSQEQLNSLVQEAVGTVEPRIRQMADEKMEEAGVVARKSQDEAVEQFKVRLQEVSDGQHGNLLESIRQKVDEAGANAAEEVQSASRTALQDLSDKVNVSASLLREQQEQASSRFESSVQDTLETFRQQLAGITEAGIEEHRKAVASSVSDIRDRLKQAAEFLTESISDAA